MRVVAWFSCGAASAVAAKLGRKKYGDDCVVVYCDTLATEHPDNARFFAQVEDWLAYSITIIRSEKYRTVDDVFEARRYMAGPRGAPCTVEMKKIPRFRFQHVDDVNIFGFTAEEGPRIARFEDNNPELSLDWVLRDQGVTKLDCLKILRESSIDPPVMYSLGFKNNNCLGCVKATSPRYWNLTRQHFPEVFARRVEQSRRLGVRLVQYKRDRIFLDQLPLGVGGGRENISCGPECGSR